MKGGQFLGTKSGSNCAKGTLHFTCIVITLLSLDPNDSNTLIITIPLLIKVSRLSERLSSGDFGKQRHKTEKLDFNKSSSKVNLLHR